MIALIISSMKQVFSQVVYLINEYVPALYKFNMFSYSHIISISDASYSSESIKYFKKYTNLKKIKMNNYDDTLEPLKDLRIQEISMNRFTGDLTPLKNAPLKHVRMDKFKIKSIDDFYHILHDQEINPWNYYSPSDSDWGWSPP